MKFFLFLLVYKEIVVIKGILVEFDDEDEVLIW